MMSSNAKAESPQHNSNNLGSEDKDTSFKIPNEESFKWGYDLYPERRGSRPITYFGWMFLGQDRDKLEQNQCEKKVFKIMNESPILKTLTGALKSAGCPINLRRHISCEFCTPYVTGGYDPLLNQVVICTNNTTSKGMIHSVLAHEFLHMFDYCAHKMDFKNLEHLACTEIRAANLTYCSFLSAWFSGHIPAFSWKQKHRDCVKKRAVESVLAVRDISIEEATVAVEKVFDKCYADLEPIGRRICKIKVEPDLIATEAFMYGYDDDSI